MKRWYTLWPVALVPYHFTFWYLFAIVYFPTYPVCHKSLPFVMKTAIWSCTVWCWTFPIPTMFLGIFGPTDMAIKLPTKQNPLWIFCFYKFNFVFVKVIVDVKFNPSAHICIYLLGGLTSWNYRSWPLLLTKSKGKELKGEAFWVDCEAVDPKKTHKPKRHQLAFVK